MHIYFFCKVEFTEQGILIVLRMNYKFQAHLFDGCAAHLPSIPLYLNFIYLFQIV